MPLCGVFMYTTVAGWCMCSMAYLFRVCAYIVKRVYIWHICGNNMENESDSFLLFKLMHQEGFRDHTFFIVVVEVIVVGMVC